ncbi:MAG: hypothetical protein ACI87E_001605, partial [Mariniblastus sp.]
AKCRTSVRLFWFESLNIVSSVSSGGPWISNLKPGQNVLPIQSVAHSVEVLFDFCQAVG